MRSRYEREFLFGRKIYARTLHRVRKYRICEVKRSYNIWSDFKKNILKSGYRKKKGERCLDFSVYKNTFSSPYNPDGYTIYLHLHLNMEDGRKFVSMTMRKEGSDRESKDFPNLSRLTLGVPYPPHEGKTDYEVAILLVEARKLVSYDPYLVSRIEKYMSEVSSHDLALAISR